LGEEKEEKEIVLMKKILLHICCAPCAIYVFEKLRKEYDVTGFFYNPNIHPFKEYEFRRIELEKISNKLGWKVVYSDYEIKKWFDLTRGYEKEPERGKRCPICFNMRLRKTFEYAKLNGFDMVASTLSISPYKVTDQINQEGLKLSKEFDIEFLAENFKKKNGYNIGRKMAAEHGIKHQNYCGCVFSKVERLLKIRNRKNN